MRKYTQWYEEPYKVVRTKNWVKCVGTVCEAHTTMGPHTAIYVSSYYYLCVLILLYMCPDTTICVGSEDCITLCPHAITECARTNIFMGSAYS